MLHIAIIGFGLLGSSLARALKKIHPNEYYILACNRGQDTLDKALALGIADIATTDVAEAAKEADIVVLATPLSAYGEIISQAVPHLTSSVAITDVGSLQQHAIDAVMPHLTPSLKKRFIPAHPIAGSEKIGIDGGDVELFYGRRIVLTPPENIDPDAEALIHTIWEHSGGQLYHMNARTHDRIYAYVSHMVQAVMMCYALAKPKVQSSNANFMRLTHYNQPMWKDIFAANAPLIKEALEGFCHAFKKIQHGPLAHRIAYAVAEAVPTSYLEYAGSGYQSIISIDTTEAPPADGDIEQFILQVEQFLLNNS